MDLSLEKMRFGFSILQWVVVIAGGVCAWWVERRRRFNKRLVKIEKSNEVTQKTFLNQLGELNGRLKDVESACENAPGHGDLSKVYERVNNISAQVAGLNAGMKALQKSVDIIHDHLLNKSGGK